MNKKTTLTVLVMLIAITFCACSWFKRPSTSTPTTTVTPLPTITDMPATPTATPTSTPIAKTTSTPTPTIEPTNTPTDVPTPTEEPTDTPTPQVTDEPIDNTPTPTEVPLVDILKEIEEGLTKTVTLAPAPTAAPAQRIKVTNPYEFDLSGGVKLDNDFSWPDAEMGGVLLPREAKYLVLVSDFARHEWGDGDFATPAQWYWRTNEFYIQVYSAKSYTPLALASIEDYFFNNGRRIYARYSFSTESYWMSTSGKKYRPIIAYEPNKVYGFYERHGDSDCTFVNDASFVTLVQTDAKRELTDVVDRNEKVWSYKDGYPIYSEVAEATSAGKVVMIAKLPDAWNFVYIYDDQYKYSSNFAYYYFVDDSLDVYFK